MSEDLILLTPFRADLEKWPYAAAISRADFDALLHGGEVGMDVSFDAVFPVFVNEQGFIERAESDWSWVAPIQRQREARAQRD